MEHNEVFKGPFKADKQCCYIWCNNGTQVCFNVMDERDARLGKRIADCLNNAPDCNRFDDIGVSRDGQYICDGHTPLLCVRGWWYLTGTGGLHLEGKEAARIQDEFVKWAAGQLCSSKAKGADLIREERRRQIEQEGYDAQHDFREPLNSIVAAAISYAMCDIDKQEAEAWWQWDFKYWKPKDRQRNLVRAGALIAAALDKMQDEENFKKWKENNNQ